jgi:delta14-sterol reductase
MRHVTVARFGLAGLGWIAFVGALFALSWALPGPLHEGPPGPDGARQRYRLNGLAVFTVTAAVVAATAAAGLWSPPVILDNIWAIFATANVFALLVGAILHATGRPTGRSGWTDFVLGRHADPRWLGVDLKLFSYRPSLIGLGLLNVAFAFAQWQRHGMVSNGMWLYQVFTLLYVANYFHFERGMLFTWDLIEERFGWGLVWGDYVLVPFFYSLPGWFLVDRVEPLRPVVLAALVLLYATGFWMFRGANEQKHRFKLDPGARIWGAPPRTIGGRLLASGFWGLARKPNYTGEILMYWAWALPCGLASPIPYLPALWLTAFLPHRARRDDHRCRAKYGDLWTRYCAEVPYRLVPFVY